jgi:autotransporter adhesin
MSNSTFTARKDRREEQLIKDVFRRRPLFSALSVLVGTGAVALSALPSQAQARSALDEMAWAPQQQTRVAQQPPMQPAVSSALNQAVSILQVPAQDAAPQAAVVSNPVPVPVEAPVAAQRLVEPIPARRSRGFADAGLIPMDAPAMPTANAADVPREAAVARSVVPVRTEPARPIIVSAPVQAAAPVPLGVSASPIRPALSIKRAPDMQADIIALRGSVTVTNVATGVDATDAVNKAQLDSATSAISNSIGNLSPALKYLRFGSSTAQTANAMGTDSLALGGNAFASQTGSVAIGLFSNSSGLNSVAIGARATADGQNSVAIGSDSSADGDNTVSVGNMSVQRRITNVAAGTTTTDAVNLGQVESLISAANSSSQQVVKNTRTLLGASVLTAQAAPVLSDVVAVGTTDKLGQAEAIGTDAVAVGLGAHATNDNTVAIGTNVAAGGVGGVAIGNLATSGGASATAVGVNAQSMGDNSLAMGTGVKSQGANSIALGNGTNVLATGSNSIAIGYKNSVSGANSIVLGNQVVGTGTNSVVLGNSSDGSQSNVVSVGAKGTERKIVNVAAGTTTTDAVNLGQMNAAIATVSGGGGSTLITQPTAGTGDLLVGAAVAGTHVNFTNSAGVARELTGVAAGTKATSAVNLSQLQPVVTALGGGAKVDATTGAVTGPTYNVQGGTQSTVGDALTSLDSGLNTVSTKVAALGDLGPNLVTQAAAGSDLLVGSKTDGTHVNFAGTAGNRELINVAAGTKDTSAVNLSQLKPVVDGLGGGAKVDPTTGAVTGPSYTIQGSTVNNAGDAFKAVDGDLTDLKTTVADIAGSTGNGLVIQDATTRAIKVAPLNDGTVVDVTGSAGARTITGVAAGSLGASSLDAINGSQLNATTSNIATAIGGGMSVDSKTGAITMPSFSVGGQPMYNVGDAITGLDGRINSTNTTLEDLTTKVSNISTGGTGTATPNAVAYDTDAHDTLTLASTSGGTTKLSGLTDGNVAAGSTDAVTGNQLSEVKDSVTTLQTTVNNIAETGTTVIGVKGADGTNGINGANGVAGSNGTAASANGADAIAMGDNASASGDHAVVIGGGASGTADGVIAIGGNSNASGKDSIAIGNGASAPAENAVALGANSVADRDNSVSIGSEGNERQLTNVAAGTKGTDAVNLNQMNQAVGGVARKAYSGIAAATALTMIPDVDANKTLSIGIGGGTFQGYAATAIGGTARITQNIKVRVGAGWSAAGTTVGAGASYQW